MCPASRHDEGPVYPTAADELGLVVAALNEAGVYPAVDPREGGPTVIVASRPGTNNWVEIIRQHDGRYLTCGYTGGVADPDDATILAVGPLGEIPGVTTAWLGQ